MAVDSDIHPWFSDTDTDGCQLTVASVGSVADGGFVGFAFFASKTGIGLLLVTSICGMLTNSLIIDKYGLLGTVKKHIGPMQYIGLILVIIGIIILRIII